MDTDTLTPLFTHRHKWEAEAAFSSITPTPAITTAASPIHIDSHKQNNSIGPVSRQSPQTEIAHSFTPFIAQVNEASLLCTRSSLSKPNLLLLLPGEIRNTIYRLVLTCPVLLHAMRRAVAASHCSSYILPALPITAALVRTCRQVHAEATPILYEENTFVAHPTLLASLPHLVDPARPLRAPGLGSKIRRWYIRVRIDCDPRYTEQDLTRTFSNALELEIEASQAMFQAASMGVLLLFKGIRAVKHVKVWGTCTESFARWLEAVITSPEGSACDEYDAKADSPHGGAMIMVPFDPWSNGNR